MAPCRATQTDRRRSLRRPSLRRVTLTCPIRRTPSFSSTWGPTTQYGPISTPSPMRAPSATRAVASIAMYSPIRPRPAIEIIDVVRRAEDPARRDDIAKFLQTHRISVHLPNSAALCAPFCQSWRRFCHRASIRFSARREPSRSGPCEGPQPGNTVAHGSSAPSPFGYELSPDRNITGEPEDLGCQKAALPAQSAVEGRSGSEL